VHQSRRSTATKKSYICPIFLKTAMPSKPLKTFIIYARKDESFKNDLMLHLKGTLVSTGHLQVWQDGDILPGEEWEKKIEQQIEAADLFLVLLSIHSLTSDFIQQKELVKALQKKSRIVPILVRSCLWQHNPVFAGLQGLPKNMKPVSSFTDQDDAWTEVMEKLHEMVEAFRKEGNKSVEAEKRERAAQEAAKHAAQERQKDAAAAAEKRRREEEALEKSLPEMVFVKGGAFQMGDEHGDLPEYCRPVHTVTLSDFQIGKYPVTQKEWKAVMGSNPSNFKGDNLPVESVSWDDCQAFIQKLNAKTGKKYRLPTEAEWEFAARGGTLSKGFKYAGSNNLAEVGWFSANSNKKPQPVGQKKANELGSHDMSGNVWEWCHDWYEAYQSAAQHNPTGPASGSARVCRGGGWILDARYCRTAYRNYDTPASRSNDIGFRLVLSALPV
jgi:formylglycine-generating enzyme required for sulfatase activity